MRHIPGTTSEPLYGAAASHAIEQAALIGHAAHGLMARAGASVAQLARAVAPHARTIWVACGPGNNGGDGLVAATHLHLAALQSGSPSQVVVTLCADPDRLPADAAHALKLARAAGVRIHNTPPTSYDLAVDALLGIGRMRPPEGELAAQLQQLLASTAPVLCVDLPSGLDADSGRHWSGPLTRPLRGERHTLALLTLKPGLFTADGRDQAGTVWLDDLGVQAEISTPASALLWIGRPDKDPRPHAAHKGSHGEVVVIGGQDIALSGSGMSGAAVLAARAALHAGAGRVYLHLLGSERRDHGPAWDPTCPELMFRQWSALQDDNLLDNATVVCGCGGGSAVAAVLPTVIERAGLLVLDADGLNAVSCDRGLQQALQQRQARGSSTILTPHPLEAARLLGTTTAEVMADRLGAASRLSERFGAVCVLKGSGTVVCAAGETPLINSSGNAALATAGTGDVLAGMIGAALAASDEAASLLHTVAGAVHHHGWLADQWTNRFYHVTLTAGALARGVCPR
jgi:hydroxyethylthiazole kinase-like uncharacterized protein yjeF